MKKFAAYTYIVIFLASAIFFAPIFGEFLINTWGYSNFIIEKYPNIYYILYVKKVTYGLLALSIMSIAYLTFKWLFVCVNELNKPKPENIDLTNDFREWLHNYMHDNLIPWHSWELHDISAYQSNNGIILKLTIGRLQAILGQNREVIATMHQKMEAHFKKPIDLRVAYYSMWDKKEQNTFVKPWKKIK